MPPPAARPPPAAPGRPAPTPRPAPAGSGHGPPRSRGWNRCASCRPPRPARRRPAAPAACPAPPDPGRRRQPCPGTHSRSSGRSRDRPDPGRARTSSRYGCGRARRPDGRSGPPPSGRSSPGRGGTAASPACRALRKRRRTDHRPATRRACRAPAPAADARACPGTSPRQPRRAAARAAAMAVAPQTSQAPVCGLHQGEGDKGKEAAAPIMRNTRSKAGAPRRANSDSHGINHQGHTWVMSPAVSGAWPQRLRRGDGEVRGDRCGARGADGHRGLIYTRLRVGMRACDGVEAVDRCRGGRRAGHGCGCAGPVAPVDRRRYRARRVALALMSWSYLTGMKRAILPN